MSHLRSGRMGQAGSILITVAFGEQASVALPKAEHLVLDEVFWSEPILQARRYSAAMTVNSTL